MDFDQKLLLLQSQLSRRYVYTASVTSGETSSLATGLPAKPQETITRIQFNIYINQSNFLGSLHEAYGLCAVGLPQFKAAGLAVVFDLTAHTFYRLSPNVTSIQGRWPCCGLRPHRSHLLSAEPNLAVKSQWD